MKRVLGYILLALFFALLYAGETVVFVLGNCHWAIIVFAPLGTFVGAALMIGFVKLVTYLTD